MNDTIDPRPLWELSLWKHTDDIATNGWTTETRRWASQLRSQYRAGHLDPERAGVMNDYFAEKGVEWTWDKQKPGPKPSATRTAEMRAEREAGASLQAIAEKHHLSRQRVHQVLKASSGN